MRCKAGLSAASPVAQSECGPGPHPPPAPRLPGCAGLGAGAGWFHHLVVGDVPYPHGAGDEQACHYDPADRWIGTAG